MTTRLFRNLNPSPPDGIRPDFRVVVTLVDRDGYVGQVNIAEPHVARLGALIAIDVEVVRLSVRRRQNADAQREEQAMLVSATGRSIDWRRYSWALQGEIGKARSAFLRLTEQRNGEFFPR